MIHECYGFWDAPTWFWYWHHGGLPVAISMTVQPTDQTSAWRPCPACLMISGAIQYGVPLMDFCPESARAFTKGAEERQHNLSISYAAYLPPHCFDSVDAGTVQFIELTLCGPEEGLRFR